MNISKELLSEVLEVEIIDFEIIWNILNYIIPNYETEEDGDLIYIELSQNINIYEFAFKCKEWALSKGYFIYSTNELSFIKTFSLETIETFSNGKDTEIECILKACEWILENKSRLTD